MPEWAWIARTFARSRQSLKGLSIVVVLGLLAAFFGLREAALPGGAGEVPLWRLLAIGVGSVPALSLSSRLALLEESTTTAFRRAQHLYLLFMMLACAVLFIAATAVILDPPELVVLLRSLCGWMGLGLLSRAIFGSQMAWLLPVGGLFMISFLGRPRGSQLAWWEFTAQPATHVPSALLVASLLGAGIASYLIDSWQVSRLHRVLRGFVTRLGRSRRSAPFATIAALRFEPEAHDDGGGRHGV